MTSFLKGVREYLTPVLAQSAFIDRGVLTPDEFVAAGDQLVKKCPTWTWASGEEGRVRPHLPADKQFLVTRGALCYKRVSQLENQVVHQDSADEENGWFVTEVTDDQSRAVGDLQTSGEAEAFSRIQMAQAIEAALTQEDHFVTSSETKDDTEYADISELEDAEVDYDASTAAPAFFSFKEGDGDDEDGGILRTRRYDVSITYDKYYQTPRVFLFGYDESGQPLTPEEMFEDIIADYAHRTVTVESHPHINKPHASVHPCQHAAVMRRIVENISKAGRQPRVDQYIFIFLKFVQSVVPTIEYDYTMEVELTATAEHSESKEA